MYFRIMYIGGKKYKIPILLNELQGTRMAIKWLLLNRSETSDKQETTIFNELVAASKNDGSAVKKRKEHHLLTFENKTYVRFLRFLK